MTTQSQNISYAVTFKRTFGGKPIGDEIIAVRAGCDIEAIYSAIDIIEKRNDGVDFTATKVEKLT